MAAKEEPHVHVDHVEGRDSSVDSFQDNEEPLGFLWMLLYGLLASLVLFTILFLLLRLCISLKSRSQLKKWGLNKQRIKQVVVGFFHPYCNAGGGGERVLWQSINALQKRYSFIRCIIYTGFEKDVIAEDILNKVYEQFGISLCERVEFVYLHRRKWVEASSWPHFTILGQNLGSIILGLEALFKFAPDVFMDTTGYAFTIPLFRWFGGCKTVSYVHYPTVSQNMLDKVKGNEQSFNNSSRISQSRILTNLKVFYYRVFAKIYGFAGRRNDVVMVNSTWTHGHISQIWSPSRLYIVYPPCDTSSFQQLPIERDTRKFSVVSVGQFRPEKDHELQLQVMKYFLDRLDNKQRKMVELVMIGSCRNQEDRDRVKELRRIASNMGIGKNIRFEINVPFDRLKDELSQATAALHTMKDEHFGICLVECMAAGCVMVGHNSGGPLMDIVVDWKGVKTGYLAVAENQYVACLREVFFMKEEQRRRLTSSAREAVRSKFSVEIFEASFLRATEHLFV